MLTMNRLLWKHKSDLAGVILRLAWRAGLKRDEIHDLLWPQVDFDGGLITLPERSIPMDENTATALGSWREQISEKVEPLEYVVTSPRTKERLTLNMISVTAQRALEKADIKNISLKDLRYDFIQRMREARGDRYAIKVSGMTANAYSKWLEIPMNEVVSHFVEDDTNYDARVWDLLMKNREGSVAIALWLSQQANLPYRQIVALTWDDINFDDGTFCVQNETHFLLKEIISMLKKEKATRSMDDDPHVILSPTKKAPMSESALSVLLRDFMVKNGVGDVYVGDIKNRYRIDREVEQIRRFAEENGFISSRTATAKLGISRGVVYDRFQRLVDSGELVRAGKGYVLAEKYIPNELRMDAIAQYVTENGSTTISKTAEYLHISRDQAKQLLCDMEEKGILDSGGNHKKFIAKSEKATNKKNRMAK